ncbi:hypothetical protein SAMD00023353_10700030 [Rosellinia necatrix]|uniref:Uncharacterized protein n=1 Tax=Rosellinia necatrix TaxID=77044 RepID=A0A1W2TWQ3_ROSNE|nr:hypothetical protein SAMD00023353_10700030 [Rosellinia necatrix]
MQFTTFALAALSMGSTIAAPALGLVSFDNALAYTGNVKTIVEEQVTKITTVFSGTPAENAVTQVQGSLLIIGQNVNGLVGPLVALGNDATTPLTQGQLASVPQLVSDCQAIVSGIKTIGKTVVGGLSEDGLNQVQPELQWVLSAAGPVVRPVVAFTTTNVPGSTAVLQKVNGAVGKLQDTANSLIVPVNGLLGGLLGGLL